MPPKAPPSEMMAEMDKVELYFSFNPVMAKADVKGKHCPSGFKLNVLDDSMPSGSHPTVVICMQVCAWPMYIPCPSISVCKSHWPLLYLSIASHSIIEILSLLFDLLITKVKNRAGPPCWLRPMRKITSSLFHSKPLNPLSLARWLL